MKRTPIIDIFRGIAVLGTLAIHLGPVYITADYSHQTLNWIWYKLWIAGGYGVFMFYVISGYLITRQIAQGRQGLFRPDFSSFYARRVGRIIPLMMLVLVAGIISLHLIPSEKLADLQSRYCFHNPTAPFSWLIFFSIFFFFSNWYRTWLGGGISDFGLQWDVFWTLSIEEQFYFFYPWILKNLGRVRDLVIFLVFLILLEPSVNALSHWAFPRWRNMSSFSSFGTLSFGCLLYFAEEKAKSHLMRSAKLCWALCAGGSLVMAWILFHSPAKIYVWVGIWGPTLVGLGLFLFLLGGFHLNFFKSHLWLPLTFPGQLSYGIYLFHTLVLYLLWNRLSGMGHFQAFFVLSSATTALAWISYRFYETPLNFKFRAWFLALWTFFLKARKPWKTAPPSRID